MSDFDRPEWLDDNSFEAIDAAEDAALDLFREGQYTAAVDAMRSVFERAIVAPALPDGFLSALAGRFERMLGSSRQAVAEAISVLERVEDAVDLSNTETHERALTLRTRLIASLADDESMGAAATVLALSFADATLGWGPGDTTTERGLLSRLRRARIELGIAAQDYEAVRDVHAAFDAAAHAVSVTGDPDVLSEVVLIRLDQADFASRQDDPERVRVAVDLARDTARVLPADERDEWLWRAEVRGIALLSPAATPDELWARAREVAASAGDVSTIRVDGHGVIAETVAERLRAEGRETEVPTLANELIAGFLSHPDPAVRAEAARWLRWIAAGRGESLNYTEPERAALQRAVELLAAETDPAVLVEADKNRLAWGRAEMHLGHEQRGVQALMPLVERLQKVRRTIQDDSNLRIAYLALGIAHSTLGEQYSSAQALDALLDITPAGHPDEAARAARAQALYWRSRMIREEGDWAAFWPMLEGLLAEFATDEAHARQWASGGLYSLWVTSEGEARTWALDRFATLFSADDDPLIRSRDVARLIAQARDARAQGDHAAMTARFEEALARYADDTDSQVTAQVKRAREQQQLFGSLAAQDAGAVDVAGPTMAEVDAINNEAIRAGDTPSAIPLYQRAAALAEESANPLVRVSGLTALENAVLTLQAIADLPQAAAFAERAVLIADDMLTKEMPEILVARVRGIRATSLQLWAGALAKLGDRNRALHLYAVAADADPSTITDDAHIRAISSSLFMRASMLDDAGRQGEAIEGYRVMIAAHRYWPDTPAHRVRVVKALRNQAQLFEQLGHIEEAAQAYRRATDFSRAGDHPELAARRVDSLTRFAELGLRAGMAADVAGWLDWALAGGLPLTHAEGTRLLALRKAAGR